MRITANSFMPVEAKIIIDGKYYTGEEFNRLVEALRAPSLSDDQQVVLEMLKEETIDRGNPYAGIYWLLANDEYPKISNKEFYQVLAAFAEWGLSTLDN